MAPPAQIFTDPTRRLGEKERVMFIDVTDVYQKILGVYMGLYGFTWIYMDLLSIKKWKSGTSTANLRTKLSNKVQIYMIIRPDHGILSSSKYTSLFCD